MCEGASVFPGMEFSDQIGLRVQASEQSWMGERESGEQCPSGRKSLFFCEILNAMVVPEPPLLSPV